MRLSPMLRNRLVIGDIAETDRLAQVLLENRVEAVMHFAALASVPDSIADPEAYYRVNVLGTKSVLDAMRAAGVRKILFSSTAATYGFHSEMPLREESPQLPETPYGTTKLAAEWLIKDYSRAYGLGYTLLRYFNACGADPRWRAWGGQATREPPDPADLPGRPGASRKALDLWRRLSNPGRNLRAGLYSHRGSRTGTSAGRGNTLTRHGKGL